METLLAGYHARSRVREFQASRKGREMIHEHQMVDLRVAASRRAVRSIYKNQDMINASVHVSEPSKYSFQGAREQVSEQSDVVE